MAGIFDQARESVSASIIEHLFNGPGAYWEGDEFWCLNPTRGDSSVGSFSIKDNGLWKDWATGEGGDLIDMLVSMRNCSKKDAAAEIIKLAGGVVQDDYQDKPAKKAPRKDKPDKPKPVLPVPESKLQGLQDVLKSSWATERHGKATKGWTYRQADGGAAFCVVRWEKVGADGKVSKDVIPYYYGADGKWHEGNAYDHGRPLFKLDQVAKAPGGTLFLVVEGEKCASVDVPGWMVTTWPGGSSATGKVDWSPLEAAALEGRVVIWPDADNQLDKAGRIMAWIEQPGMKAALAIARRLPGAKVLDVQEKAKVKNGWDLADAVSDGVDPVAFIAASLPRAVESTDRTADVGEFACLGHDGTHHWFLRRGVRVPYKIALGSFNSSKILSLAPLAFWSLQGMVNDQGGIRAAAAQDFIEGLSFGVGQYRPERIRGAGVWRDKDGMLVNDGGQLIMADGSIKQLDDYPTEYHYISSSTQFGSMIGPESDDDDGKTLEKLFRVQGFTTGTQAVLAMGWSLIAPFGGVLRWRPHIWVTGRKGSGKSWVLEDLVRPLCGPFAHKGSGKDSEAGIRRSLNMDARPVILDEMEPKGQRATEKVASILDLARNASSDGSGYITIASPDGGTQRFVVRSCFCFGSIQTPDEGAAIASRISRIELRAPADQAAKFRASAALYAECMGDPGRFTRRIFRALPRILADIEWLRTEFLDLFGEQRRADQVAPLMAAAWAAQSTDPLRGSKDGLDWLDSLSADLSTDADAARDDEEEVIDHILSAHIKVEHGIKTVAELLRLGYVDLNQWAQEELARYGIRVYSRGLAIADRSEQIRGILKNTPYATGYGAQIKRHRLAVSDKPAQVRMAGNRVQCWVLDWNQFQTDYIEDGAQQLLPDDPPF